MAWERNVFEIPGAVAGSDMSSGNGYSSTGQFLIVTASKDRAANTHVPCTSHKDRPSGIAQNDPKSGEGLAVMALGVSKVLCGATISAGDEYGPDNNGKAVKKNPTSTGADYGDYVLGQVLEGGAAGELATVTVYGPYRI